MSSVKVLWRCAQDHEWPAAIASRALGTGCPVCWSKEVRSAPEIALVNSLVVWLGQTAPKFDYAIAGLRWDSGSVVAPDFVLDHGPIRFAVEYDGRWFHSRRDRIRTDRIKTQILHDAGFVVIRIRETPLPTLVAACDLVLDTTAIYQDQALGFPYLVNAAQGHIDAVCRREFGDLTWSQFLTNTATDPTSPSSL